MDDVLVARSPEQLQAVNAVIHDCFFERDQIVFDENQRELRIPFEYLAESDDRVLRRLLFLTKTETPFVQASLSIRRVSDWSIDDTQEVGSYDFNKLVYNPGAQEVVILTGIPIDIRATVEGFEIAVAVSDSVVGWQRGWKWFGLNIWSRPRERRVVSGS